MGKLSLSQKLVAWEKSQALGTVASAALDVESHILDSASVEEVHNWRAKRGLWAPRTNCSRTWVGACCMSIFFRQL